MKKRLFIINVIFFMLIALFVASGSFAETKKVLVLQIIEENWDDLELILPKSDGVPIKIAKKEALKDYREYKTRAIKKEAGVKEEIIEDIIKSVKLAVSQKGAPKDSDNKLYIKHEIIYLGKAYYLGEESAFMEGAFRVEGGYQFRKIEFGYYYEKLPNRVSLLLEPKYFDKTRGKFNPNKWNDFKEIRLVEDLYILNIDEVGNLKIKYDDKNYNVKVVSILELPAKEKILSRKDMMKFREKYFEYYAKEYPWKKPEASITSSLKDISISNESFRFGTKVTIINNGYEEIKGD